MKKLNEILSKNFGAIFLVLCFMLLLSTCNSCASKNESQRNKKAIKSLTESVNSKTIDPKEIKIMFKIESLKASRNNLHDMNEIVLKNIRPAKRIADYNKEIDQLEKKLEVIRGSK